MSLAVSVLDMTRGTVRFVTRDEWSSRIDFQSAIVTSTTRRARSLTIDWVETLVATRTRQLPFLILLQIPYAFYSVNMYCVKLLAPPLLLRIFRYTFNGNLF